MNINFYLNLFVFVGFLSVLVIFVLVIKDSTKWQTWVKKPWHMGGFLVSIIALGVGTFTPRSSVPGPIQPRQVRQVLSQDHLLTLLQTSAAKRDGSEFLNLTPGAAENTNANTDGNQDNSYVDTNSQVAGVKEGDVIKTDGQMIYYASRWDSRVRVMSVDSQNVVNYVTTIQLSTDTETIYTDSMYLTKDYLVIIGYRYDLTTSSCVSEDENGDVYMCPNFMWWQPTGSVVVINRDDLTIAYSLRTNAAFIDHRIVPVYAQNGSIQSETLYLVGHHYLYAYDQTQELRPYAIEYDGEKTYMPYQDMFYIEQDNLYAMTTITSVLLPDQGEPFTYQSKGYLGATPDYKKLYVNHEHLYLAQANYHYDDAQSYQSTTIFKFVLDVSMGGFHLTTVGTVRGTTVNQFALDEFEGSFRIATTETVWDFRSNNWWWSWESRQITNRLYILVDQGDGSFTVQAMIDQGLGKPGESIMSVRFVGEKAYIVTFLRTDPLYIIDLSDPLNPVIQEELILPGFDTYQHPWGDQHLIGLGYDADEQGNLTGMKLTAYDVSENDANVMQTVNFSQWLMPNDENGLVWGWSWAEALWDHKAIAVSVDHGVFAFAVNAYSYRIVTEPNRRVDGDERPDGDNESEPGWVQYEFTYHSYFFIFKIDVTNPLPIADPIIIEHPTSEIGYVQVDRGVIINDVIHTFSNQQMISYDLGLNQILQTLIFPEYL